MNYVGDRSKWTVVVFMTLASTMSVSLAQQAPDRSKLCHESIRRVRADKRWVVVSTISALPPALYQGTYKGIGRVTRHTYYLHLLQYLNEHDSFIAVSEDDDTGRASIGFIAKSKASDAGVYDWFGINVASERAHDELDVAMDRAPLFQFSLQLDSQGRVEKVVATNSNPSLQLESVEYEQVRATLLSKSLRSGAWKKRRNQMRLLPIGEGSSDPCGSGPSRFTALYDEAKSDESGGGRIHRTFAARQEGLPGVFALREVKSEGYRRLISPSISKVAVYVEGYDHPYWIFGRSRSHHIYVFSVKDGYLSADPDQLKLEN